MGGDDEWCDKDDAHGDEDANDLYFAVHRFVILVLLVGEKLVSTHTCAFAGTKRTALTRLFWGERPPRDCSRWTMGEAFAATTRQSFDKR
jgi:hypothetical protein